MMWVFLGVMVAIKITETDVVNRLNGRPITLISYAGGTAKQSTFLCGVCGHVWQASLNNVTHSRNPTGCPCCAPNARVSEVDVFNHLAAVQIELVKYCGTTNGHSDLRCLVCGHEWHVGFNKIQMGSGCPACANSRKGLSRLDTGEELERLVDKPFVMTRYGGKVASISDFLCSKCGHEWSTTLNSITNGTGCPKCAGRLLIEIDEATDRLKERNIVIRQYGGNTMAKSLFSCTVDGCGHEWSTTLGSVLHRSGCPKCSGCLQVTEVEARRRLEGRNLKLATYSGNASEHSTFECLADGCGHVWDTSFANVSRGTGCPKCGGKLKLLEADVRKRLEGRPIELLEYAGVVRGKSKFKCTNTGCAHEWLASFNNIHNAGQGCPACAQNGFNPDKPTDLYVYRLVNNGDAYIGFGITGSPRSRYSAHAKNIKKADATGEILAIFKMSGKAAQDYERLMKKVLPIEDSGIKGFKDEALRFDDALLSIILKGAERQAELNPV